MAAFQQKIQLPATDKNLQAILEQAGYSVSAFKGTFPADKPADYLLLNMQAQQTLRLQQSLIALLASPQRSLLQLARAIQTAVPFDYCLADHCGFLRIGRDEYQVIDPDAFAVMTGMKWPWPRKAPSASILQGAKFKAAAQRTPWLKKLAGLHGLNASLTVPAGNTTIRLYSRNAEAYTQEQLALLQQLAPLLQYAAGAEQTDLPSLPRNDRFEGIIGAHPSLLRVFDHIERVAPQDTTVLLLGESGTGKELVAKAVHRLSQYRNGPFVRINCASLPPDLIESELFGYESGAFTGAASRRKGKFEQAQDGSIFLDEIGEMPHELQSRLLRVLQEKEIEPLGSNTPIPLNVRVIAATHRDLEKAVGSGEFRLDLYYRLSVFPITLPPLRERLTDVRPLATHFAVQAFRRLHKPFPGISATMMAELETFQWPGNIRELENVITQAVILSDGKSPLQLAKLLHNPQFSAPSVIANLHDLKLAQQQTEREYLLSILRQANGKVRGEKGAAAILRIKPTTLESRMEKLGISRKDLY